ncbi:MAG: Ig-like domain-containing protein [Methanomassiliicoccales archaeon]
MQEKNLLHMSWGKVSGGALMNLNKIGCTITLIMLLATAVFVLVFATPNASAGTYTLTFSPSGCSGTWYDASNAYADDGLYAYSTAFEQSEYYTSYGINLPSDAVVTGVELGLDAWTDSYDYLSGTVYMDDIYLQIYDGSSWTSFSPGGDGWDQELVLTSVTETTYWKNITTWSTGGWTPSELSAIQTRVYHDYDGSYQENVYLDWIRLEVTYTSSTNPSDTTASTIESVIPVDEAVDVSISTTVQVTFSEAMDTTSVESAFSLVGIGSVTGTFAWSVGDTVMTFTPSSALSYNTEYTVTIGTGAKDLAGNGLAAAFTSSFTTGAHAEIQLIVDTYYESVQGDDLYILVGKSISWRYYVTNIGSVDLTNVDVYDSVAGVTPSYAGGPDEWNGGVLKPGVTLIYTAPGTAVAGVYSNTGTVTCSYAGHDGTISDTDISGYLGAVPDIDIDTKTVEGSVSGDGLTVLSLTQVYWNYTVINTGNVPLIDVYVTDTYQSVNNLDRDSDGYNDGDINKNRKLDIDEAWYFRATRGAVVGDYSSTGTVYARFVDSAGYPVSPPPSASDGTSYFGANPRIALTTVTIDGTNSGDGIEILAGNPITWRYTVTNTGNVPLENINVYDDVVSVRPTYVSGDTNDDDKLDLTETWIYEAYGTAISGSYWNNGTAVGTFFDDAGYSRGVQYTDISSYFGVLDDTTPIITTIGPADGSMVTTHTPTISASFSDDDSGIDVDTIVIKVDGIDLTFNASASSTGFSFAHDYLADGVHSVSIELSDLAGNPASISWHFTVDTTAPTVVTVDPSNGALDVSIGTTVQVTFSEAMDTTSVESAFSLVGIGSVTGTFAWSVGDTVMTFTPSSALSYNTEYTVTIGTGAKDLAGNGLAAAFTSSFVIEDEPDTTAPTVVTVDPSNGALDVSIGTTVQVTFSEAMDTTSVESAFSLVGIGSVTGTFAWSVGDTVMTFTPSSALSYNTEYTVTIGTGAKDLAGNGLAAAFTSSFVIEDEPDTTAPTVVTVDPSNGALDVSIGTTVQVTFSEAMDTTSVESAFSLVGIGSVTGTFAWSVGDTVMTFTPSSALSYNTEYTVTIGTGAKDLAGNGLAAAFTSLFITEQSIVELPPTITDYVDGQQIRDLSVTPTIGAIFSDSQSGVDTSRTVIIINGAEVTSSATVSETGFTYPTSLLIAGWNTVSVTVYDNAGESTIAAWNVQVLIKYDTTPPSIRISYTFDKRTNTGTIVASIIERDSGLDTSTVRVLFDGVDVTDQCTWDGSKIIYPIDSLTPGTHTVVVIAADFSGNYVEVTKTITVRLPK